MTPEEIQTAIAPLHLVKGDALIINGKLLSPLVLAQQMKGPGCAVFPVYPKNGQTLRDAFLVMHEEELKKLSLDKLKELLNAAS